MPKLIHLTKKHAIDLEGEVFKKVGLRAWITGESGSGKSTTSMLIASQWLAHGNQLIVLDSHGEYRNLWTVKPSNVELFGYDVTDPIHEGSTDWILDSVREGKSVVIDLKHWTSIQTKPLTNFLGEFAPAVYKLARQKPMQRLFMLEEAQEIAPQAQRSGQYENVLNFVSMLTGGRKFGLQFLLASQQQGLVDKRVITQCNFRAFHSVSEKSDWDSIRPYVADLGITFGKGKNDISSFQSGEAVVTSKWFRAFKGRFLMPEVKVQKFLDLDEEVA